MSKLVDYYKLTLAVLAAVLLLIYFAFNPPVRKLVVSVEPDMQPVGRMRLALKKDLDYRIYISPNADNEDHSLYFNSIPVNTIFGLDMQVLDANGTVVYKAEEMDWLGDPVSLGHKRVGIEVIKASSRGNKPLRLDADGIVTVRWTLKPLGGDDDEVFDPDCALYFTTNIRTWMPSQPVLVVE